MAPSSPLTVPSWSSHIGSWDLGRQWRWHHSLLDDQRSKAQTGDMILLLKTIEMDVGLEGVS